MVNQKECKITMLNKIGILHRFNYSAVGDFTKFLYSDGCQQGKQKFLRIKRRLLL